MPFDGSGNFSRLYNWQSDRDNGIHILASRMDGEFDNFAAGMNVVFFRNGLVPMSGNLNMGQNYITGLGAGSVGALPLRFADDPNSGLFLNGYNKPTLAAGGVARLEANTAGVAVTGTLNSSGALTQNGQQVWHAGNFTPGDYMPKTGGQFTGSVQFGDANFLMAILGNPIIGFDVNDYYQYNRTNNTHNLAINSSNIFSVNAAGAIVAGTFSSTGALTQNGQQVWHAGNFNPANYAALSGATFTGSVNTNGILRTGATGQTGTVQFARSVDGAVVGSIYWGANSSIGPLTVDNLNGGDVALAVSGATRLLVNNAGAAVTGTLSATGAVTQNGNQVWHAGNFNPANYAALAGATFTARTNIGVAGEALRLYGSAPFISFYDATQTTSRGYIQHDGSNLAIAPQVGLLQVTGGGLNVTGTVLQKSGANVLARGATGLSATVTQGTAAPSGGSDGDIYLQYA